MQTITKPDSGKVSGLTLRSIRPMQGGGGMDSFPWGPGGEGSCRYLNKMQALFEGRQENDIRRPPTIPHCLWWTDRSAHSGSGVEDGQRGRSKTGRQWGWAAVWEERPWDLDPFCDSHQGEERASGNCEGEFIPVILQCLGGNGPFQNLSQAVSH